MTFANRVPLLGSRAIPFDNKDRVLVPKDCIVRTIVINASGLNEESPPGAFQLVGRLDLFRPDTILDEVPPET